MYRHIVVPLDGSPLAEAALPAAAWLAAKMAARVTLVHVIEQNAPSRVHGTVHLTDPAEAAAYLEQVARKAFAPDIQVSTHVHTKPTDDVAAGIAGHAGELGHDLIVMCAHGRGGLSRMFVGTIAQKVISLGTLPVLLTRPAPDGNAPAFSCSSILVPLDGNPAHERALPVTASLAAAFGSTLHLLTVVPEYHDLANHKAVPGRLLPGTTSKMLEIAAGQAGSRLASHVAALRERGLTAESHVLRGDPADEIVNAANSTETDLLVLATHGKSGMSAFWAGSVAHRACSRCRIPVLLIPIVAGN